MTEQKHVAIFLTDFKLKKGADTFFQRYSEPYFVSFTIVGGEQSKDKIFPAAPMIYPQVRAGDKITFAGEGHLLSVPKVPRQGFVYFSILFMESDSDMRRIGKVMTELTQSVWESSKDMIRANPTAFVGAAIGKSILGALAIGFSENSDDMLFRLSGTFLRSSMPSFGIGETYRFGNDWIDCGITVRDFSNEEYEEFKTTSTYNNFEKLQKGDLWDDNHELDKLAQKLSFQE